jgi:formylglycine-generating enzyme required for sulfatase activity
MNEGQNGGMNKLFCSNCGKQIPINAKFCIYCGQKIEDWKEHPSSEPKIHEQKKVIKRESESDDMSFVAYQTMEPGASFNNYKVIKLQGKDTDGIRYLVEKEGKYYVLKLFFPYKYSNLENIITLQNWLDRVQKLQHPHIVNIEEINYNNDPVYIITEFVEGMSLAKIKTYNPTLLTESLVREIAKQLVSAAIDIRLLGLSIKDLTLNSIVLNPETNKITILTSGISYEATDERDEVFHLGVLLAQMLSANQLAETVYNDENLREHKFTYIPGITLSMNKVLGECLHRNILQRYKTLHDLLKGLNALPAIEKDEVYDLAGAKMQAEDISPTQVPEPKISKDWIIFTVVGIAVAAIIIFFVLNWSNITKDNGTPSTWVSSINEEDTINGEYQDNSIFNYRDSLKSRKDSSVDTRVDPRKAMLSQNQSSYSGSSGSVKIDTSPDRTLFVHISDGTFGFTRLKENPNHNVVQNGFYMGKYEVTQKEWNQYMKPANVSFVGDNLPVDNVSWMNIVRYCNARSEAEGLTTAYTILGNTASSVTCNFKANGYRLPTEAEWEMAAKGGQLYTYSGSDDADEVAWYRENSGRRYRTVGYQKKPNAYGIYDMTGNVAEWCWDWYSEEYPTSLTEFINPRGPATGTLKVIRGGSVNNGLGTNLSVVYRTKGNPAKGYPFVGFRLVRTY